MMKKKILLGTCALAACLGACTNEDFLTENSGNNNLVNNEIVGADLASHGMNIVLEGAQTRAYNGGWDNGDIVGLAWYNMKGKSGIYAPQDETTWLKGAASRSGDDKIYANHQFMSDGSTFSTQADVYQGAYFAYWPYKSQASADGVIEKTIEVNGDVQTGNFAADRYNKALHISAQDFIAAGAGVDENHKLTRNFLLTPAVNVFAVKATIENVDATTDAVNFFKNLSVTQLDVNAGGTNNGVFVSSAKLRPSYIPDVVMKNGAIDVEKTTKALDDAAAKAANTAKGSNTYLKEVKFASTVTTEVRNAYTIANAGTDENRIRVFAFPFAKKVSYSAGQNPSATIKVGMIKDGEWKYDLGEFEIEAKDNSTFTEKLKGILAGTGSIDMSKLLRTNDGAWTFVNLDAALLLKHFTPLTLNIQSEEQWNDLVKVYDALYDLKAIDPTADDFEAPVFRLGKSVTFTGTTIATPKNLNIMLETTDGVGEVYEMSFSNSEVTWPKNLLTSGSSVIRVPQGTTLNVGVDNENEININSVIYNNGVINAGGLVSLSANNAQPIYNNGRIIIEYGAYVYPNAGEEGVIAYEVSDTEPETIGNINTLITKTADTGLKEYAQVNTLIVSTDLNLNASAAYNTGDRYQNASGEKQLKDLSGIDIELNNGSVFYVENENTKNYKKVKNVSATAAAGTTTTNSMTDVDVVEDVTTQAGATLDVKTNNGTTNINHYEFVNINNHGSLNVYANMLVEKVNNYKGGNIKVEEGYKVTYTTRGDEGYLQEGKADGLVIEQGAGEKQIAKNVQAACETLLKGWADEGNENSTYTEFVTDFTAIEDAQWEKANLAKEFLSALNTWRTAYNYDEIASHKNLTVTDLKLFVNTTGLSLGLTD